MARVIAYDLVRLFTGPLFVTPRGIDRIDLALARHVFASDCSANVGILPTPWGVRAFPAASVRRLLDKLEEQWSERVEANADRKLDQLVAQLLSVDAVRTLPSRAQSPLSLKSAGRLVLMLQSVGGTRGSCARGSIPQGSIYVNVGQLGLAVPLFHRWLSDRPDLISAIMLHDVIPLEHPELVGSSAVSHHVRMVSTAASRAKFLLFTSYFARDSVMRAIVSAGLPQPPSFVRTLPVSKAYMTTRTSLPELAHVNYFVVVSTVEPRKNHHLLLRTWQRMLARGSASVPHLVIVGSLGYRSHEVLAVLEADPSLKSHVHFVSGLSSAALASLVLGATGLLSPTFAEGFGLPVLEANALGVPTIASDIAAHREIGNGSTQLLRPDDDAAWEQAVLKLASPGVRARQDIPFHLSEEAYCSDVIAFLRNHDAH